MYKWYSAPPARDTLVFFAICFLVWFIRFCIKDRNKVHDTLTVNYAHDGPVYDGFEQFTYELKSGETANIHINIKALSGAISISVTRTDASEAEIFDERITESRVCDVPVTAPGTYKVVITADCFHGSYDVDWE